ncbi:class I SAM-dependent methyltransferase [Campylobacter concisus]|jgi:putative RNA methylase|uniref:class I SAM-dependent methyltransferase n=1 Tax=Campylobacter concisus TaxID=199 RepID=UPI000CD83A18|nr:class I SAM-dependent methyltransferase [Campylobacter concisus]
MFYNYIDENFITNLLKKKNIKNCDEILNDIEKLVKDSVATKIKEYQNKNRIIKNDETKIKFEAIKKLSKEQIKTLPSWVKDDIEKAYVIGESKNVIMTSDGKKYSLQNKLNDLSGGEWTYFLNSVVSTKYLTSGDDSYAHHIRKIHPSPKPPQLMRDIIKFFTKENELVFDFFAGVGGTLLGASLCNRKAIGIDLNQNYINAYQQANKYLNLKEQKFICGNSLEILKDNKQINQIFDSEKASLILIDPPYGDMMARNKTGEAVKKGKDTSPTPFTNLEVDLGNMEWNKFLIYFKQSIVDSMQYLKDKGHIVVFIKDMQPNKKSTNLLHADVINELNSLKNLRYLGTKIWADLNVNLYPYGYPHAFVANQIHQYIMIFRKESLEK